MQKAMIAGNLGRDAELRQHDGADILSFAVGVSARRDDPTTWYDCTMWGKRASALARYLTKGTKVCVSGTLGLRTYQKKNGEPGASITIRVDDITLQGGGEPAQQRRDSSPAPS